MNDCVRWRALRHLWAAGSVLVISILVATQPAAGQRVQGRLVDASSGKPVPAAEMFLLAGESGSTVVKRGLTTDSGTFSFTADAPGRYRLKAERIGYRAVISSPFDLVASEPLHVELKVSVQAVPLAPLTVVSPRPALLGSIRLVSNGFFDREQEWGPKGLHLGTFIDKQTIERRQPTQVTDLLRMIPGVIVEHQSGDRSVVRMGQVTTMAGPCAPMLYLDGQPIRLVAYVGGSLTQVATIDELVPPSSIAGIEVYSKINKPGQFTDMGAAPCGAIVIWTGYVESASDSAAGSDGSRAARLPGGEPLQLGLSPRQDQNTSTAGRLLRQADTMRDKSAARSVYRQALDAAHAAIIADSTNPLPRLQAGEAAIGAGDYREADTQLKTADRLRPIYELRTRTIREMAWFALYGQARPLLDAGQYDRAVPILENADVIYRERPEAMLALGQIYGQEGKDDRALANLDSAAMIIQDSSKLALVDSATVADWKARLDAVEVTRAEVLAHAGRYDESIDAFREVVRKHPDDVDDELKLAQLLVRTGKREEAERAYDAMLRGTALTATDLYAIGVGCYEIADYADAAKALAGAATRSPKDRDALAGWTHSLAMDSAYTQVPSVAERWITLDPNNPTAYTLEAQALKEQGNGQKARELLNRIRNLKVTVEDLDIHRGNKGGASITGTVTNRKLASGAQVTITFTFYDEAGDSLGTQSRILTMGGEGQAQQFTVGFDSDARVGGYGYTVSAS